MPSKTFKKGQEVFIASTRLIEPENGGLPFLFLPGVIDRLHATANSPTLYIKKPTLTAPEGPWLIETEVFETEAEALTAGIKIAMREIEAISRDAQNRVTSILRTVDGFAPGSINSITKAV